MTSHGEKRCGTCTTLVFKLRAYMASQGISIKGLQYANLDVWRGHLGELVVILRGFIMERDLENREHTFTCQYPATWLDALRKALGWKYRKRYVRERVTFTVAERYPDAEIKLPEDQMGKAVVYSRLESDRDEGEDDE